MEKAKFYTLPQLPYGYDQLQPYVSQEQLTLHHQNIIRRTSIVLMPYLRGWTRLAKKVLTLMLKLP